MLTISKNSPKTSINDPLSKGVDNFMNLVKIMTSITEESSKDSWRYIPHLLNINIYPDEFDGETVFLFNYERNEHVEAFAFPVFTDLRDKELDIETPINDAPIDNLKVDTKGIYDYSLTSLLYHPNTVMAATVCAAANILTMCLKIAGGNAILPSFAARAPLLANLGLAGIAIVYFGPVLFYLFKKDLVRKELEVIFKESQKFFEDGYLNSAYQNLNRLSFTQKLFLRPDVPGNSDLRWSYNFLRGLLQENRRLCFRSLGDPMFYELMETALELSVSENQRFKVIRSIINGSDLSRKYNNMDALDEPCKNDEKLQASIALSNKFHQDRIKPYIGQLPTKSQMHIQLAKDLHHALNEVLDTLLTEDVDMACTMFHKIYLDGYCKVAYPASAILYYQIESVLSLLTDKFKNPGVHKEMDNFQRETLAEYNFLKIQRYIDKHFPDQSERHQRYIDVYNETKKEWYNKPNRPEAPTSRPITPMATSTMKRADSIEENSASSSPKKRCVT